MPRPGIRVPACAAGRRAGGEADHCGDADAREGAARRIPPQSSGFGRQVRPAVRSQFLLLERPSPSAGRTIDVRMTLEGCPRPWKAADIRVVLVILVESVILVTGADAAVRHVWGTLEGWAGR